MNLKICLMVMTVLLWVDLAEAQRKRRVKKKKRRRSPKVTKVQDASEDLKKFIWLGAGLGPAMVISNDESLETSKSGLHVAAMAKLGMVLNNGSFELGLGFSQTNISADSDPGPILEEQQRRQEEDSSFVGLEIGEIDTSYGIAEIGARYRITPFFELGPLVAIPFGVDTSFGPTIEEDPLPNFFIGGGVYINFNKPTYRRRMTGRLGAQLITDLTIDERQVFLPTFLAEFGMLIGSKPKVMVKERFRTRVKTKVKYKTKVVKQTQIVTQEKNNYLIDAGIINFITGRYDINPHKTDFLRQLAAYLNLNSARWERIQLISHTDKRGSVQLNERLSANRAESVANILRSAGIPQGRINIRSLASSDPVMLDSSQISYAKNRRVEILVVGGPETPTLKSYILKLQQRYKMPTTCQADGKCK